MFRLARMSLANRVLVGLITVLIAVFGVLSMTQLRQELIPDITLPQTAVVTIVPGASPEVIDEQVGQPISQATANLAGVEQVLSTSSANMSIVTIAYEYGIDPDTFQASVRRTLDGMSSQLPSGADPQILAGSTSDIPVLFLTASQTDATTVELTETVNNVVIPRVRGVEGVRSAAASGGAVQRVVITPDQQALMMAGLDASAISAALQANGITFPLGSVAEDGAVLPVQGGHAITSLDDVRGLPLAGAPSAALGAFGDVNLMRPGDMAGAVPGEIPGDLPSQAPDRANNQTETGEPGAEPAPQPSGNNVTPLGAVADVDLVTQPASSITRMNGQPAVSIMVIPAQGGDVVAISHDVNVALDELAAEFPALTLTVVFDQAPFIEESISHLTIEGLLGLLFAVVVILLFLLSVRSTLVTAISIPLSVLVAFVGLNLGGYSLNMLTLGALTIAIGRVVDDSIVVVENIKRHLSYGTEKKDAILTGVREVAGAITSSTLTTVAVFVPIAVVGGMVGELFAPFALTITIAMLSSLLVALTIVPVLSYWFLPRPQQIATPDEIRATAEEKEHRSVLQRSYKPILTKTQRHPVITVAVSVLLLIGTGALLPLLKVDFIGNTGQNAVMVTQEFPAGSSLDTMSQGAEKVEAALTAIEGVDDVLVTAGSGDGDGMAAMFGGGSAATFMVSTDKSADQVALQDTIRDRLATIDDAGDIALADGAAMSGFGGTVDVKVSALTDADLAPAATAVYDALADTPHITDISSDLAPEEATVRVEVDRTVALEYGLSEMQLLGMVAGILSPQSVGNVMLEGVEYPIYVDAMPAPATPGELAAMPLPTAAGMVTLADMAAVDVDIVPVSISRDGGDLVATISLTPAEGELGAVTSAVNETLDALALPAGASATIGGLAEQQQESFEQLGLAMLVAIAIVFTLLVATFRSLLQPLILLVSIPFAATGAMGLLLITGRPLGISALIGMLMLIGIVVTNAIVLIDLINQYRRAGQSLDDAVFNGSRQRLRPILMTAIATIFALIPMALGVTGSSGFISQDLAIVVIGGLISSTALTLVLVPVLYHLFEVRRARKQGQLARGVVDADISRGMDPGSGLDRDSTVDDSNPVGMTGGKHAVLTDEESR